MMPWQQSLQLYLAYCAARHRIAFPADATAVEQAQGISIQGAGIRTEPSAEGSGEETT